MTASTLVWITARDGSIHATRAPIFTLGQSMLCARAYGRVDLKVRSQLRIGDRDFGGACPVCRDAAEPPVPPKVSAKAV